MARIARVEVFVHRAPIAVPVRNAFGTLTNRASVFVRLEDSDGAVGWGEIWCNFPTIGAEHRARLFDDLVAPHLLGRDPDADPAAFFAARETALHVLGLQCGEPGAIAAVIAGADIALHDLAARRVGQPLWRALGGADASPVAAYASGINPGPDAPERVAAARDAGFRAFKVKVGFGQEADIATLTAVAAALQAGERLMTDANQAWTLEAALAMAPALGALPLDWLEEPMPVDRPAAEWAALAGACRIPLAGGENLRGLDAFAEAAAAGHLAVIQPDACKWGGITGTLAAARGIGAAGRRYCPHYLGGGIGLMASLHLLAAAGGDGLLEVDANPNPLREELLGAVMRPTGGRVALPQASGLGVTPDLAPFAALRTAHLERH